MKPVIGINMTYEEFTEHKPNDVPRFRDSYKLYISYADAVQESGGIALLIPPFTPPDPLDSYLGMVQGFLFTGGDDYPPILYDEPRHPETKLIHERRVNADLYLARKLLASQKPVLAICGGIQLVSIVSGGKLIQHLENLGIHNKVSKIVDNAHRVSIEKDSLLYSIFGKDEIGVNSAHHQAINPDYPGKKLRVTAVAGDGVIEALELEDSPDRFFLAVQWHPERIGDREHRKLLFDAFIDAAGSFSA